MRPIKSLYSPIQQKVLDYLRYDLVPFCYKTDSGMSSYDEVYCKLTDLKRFGFELIYEKEANPETNSFLINKLNQIYKYLFIELRNSVNKKINRNIGKVLYNQLDYIDNSIALYNT